MNFPKTLKSMSYCILQLTISEIREIYLKAYYGPKYKAAEGAPAID